MMHLEHHYGPPSQPRHILSVAAQSHSLTVIEALHKLISLKYSLKDDFMYVW